MTTNPLDATAETAPMTVGEVAEATGLTVRTLHHWEAVGLVAPGRSEGGHRLYGGDDLGRVARIALLQQLGVPLAEVGRVLDDPGSPSLLDVLDRSAEELRSSISDLQRRLDGVLAVEEVLRRSSGADDDPGLEPLLGVLRTLGTFIGDLSPEQLERLQAASDGLPHQELMRMEEAGTELTRRLQAAFDAGVAPGADDAQALCREWNELMGPIVGGDDELRTTLLAWSRRHGDALGEQLGVPTLTQPAWDWFEAALALQDEVSRPG